MKRTSKAVWLRQILTTEDMALPLVRSVDMQLGSIGISRIYVSYFHLGYVHHKDTKIRFPVSLKKITVDVIVEQILNFIFCDHYASEDAVAKRLLRWTPGRGILAGSFPVLCFSQHLVNGRLTQQLTSLQTLHLYSFSECYMWKWYFSILLICKSDRFPEWLHRSVACTWYNKGCVCYRTSRFYWRCVKEGAIRV